MKITAFTGAGISAASGIPTFEEMGQHIRDKLSRDYYYSNTQEFFKLLYQMKLVCDRAEPNAAHISIAEHGLPVITMNIDGLHRRAGSKEIVEIHGDLEHACCIKCGRQTSLEAAAQNCRCESCGGLLDSNVVLYGDGLDRLGHAYALVDACDVLLVVGTSFFTSTSSIVCDYAKALGKEIIMCNVKAEEQLPGIIHQLLQK